jgi:hypothetical protein
VIKPRVGEPWPDGIEAKEEERAERHGGNHEERLGLIIVILLGVLLACHAVYAFWVKDQQLVMKVFELVRDGLMAFIIWLVYRGRGRIMSTR